MKMTTDLHTRIIPLHFILKSDELSSLVENVIVMIDCGHFPHEAFHEVRAVYKLLLNLKVGVKEDEAFN